MPSLAKQLYLSELAQIDWDFTGENGSAGFAGYHWYPARFVPQLPGILISYLSEPGDLVLDPFCGSGTTLVEAYKLGRRAVGIDVNPMGVLMTKAKLISFEDQVLEAHIASLLQEARILFEGPGLLRERAELAPSAPNQDENEAWYHADTLRELSSIWVAINRVEDERFRVVGLASFSAILRHCCSQDKHWGWICDNVKPKEKVYRNAFDRFAEKLAEYRAFSRQLHLDAQTLQEAFLSPDDIQAQLGDSRVVLSGYEPSSFDIVVTSPPYYNMTDYTKSQRLSLLWFGESVESIREQEIGARFKRFRSTSWQEYLAGLRDSFSLIADRLKPGGFCCVVLGESPRHQPFLSQFRDLCNDIGLAQQDSITRRIAKQRSLSPNLHDERILIYRKLPS